jgi:imidazoleglycerol phosphate synthase glutamine amidotransferase subunit HisH
MITVIDYGTGNLGSIVNIGKKAGGKLRISSDPAVIRDSDKLILPGVGAFDRGMQNLQAKQDPLLDNIPLNPRFYFVHSFHLKCDDSSHVLAWADYGLRFVCAIQVGNIWGTQFHPEKSHKFGLQLIKNFIAL